jgi:hypothetical protein
MRLQLNATGHEVPQWGRRFRLPSSRHMPSGFETVVQHLEAIDEKVPSSVDFSDGEKRDRNLESPVPPQARIGLADVVFIEFRSTSTG